MKGLKHKILRGIGYIMEHGEDSTIWCVTVTATHGLICHFVFMDRTLLYDSASILTGAMTYYAFVEGVLLLVAIGKKEIDIEAMQGLVCVIFLPFFVILISVYYSHLYNEAGTYANMIIKLGKPWFVMLASTVVLYNAARIVVKLKRRYREWRKRKKNGEGE